MTVALDALMVYAAARRGTGKNLVDLYATLAAVQSDWRFLMFHQVVHPGPFTYAPSAHRLWSAGVNFPGAPDTRWRARSVQGKTRAPASVEAEDAARQLDETVYREDGPDYFERPSRDRVVRRYLRHLEQLGNRVTLEPAA